MSARDHKTAKIGEELLPLDIDYLPDNFLKKAEAEVNYTETVRRTSLQELKNALANDSVFHGRRFTDSALLMFLTAKKYDIDRTVSKLRQFVKFKYNNLDLYTNISFEVLSSFLSTKFLSILPWRCQDGCTLFLIRLGKWDAKKYPMLYCHRMLNTLLLQALRHPMTQVNGFKLIADFKINIDLLRICTPHNFYAVHSEIERVLPGRVKGYHFVNMGLLGQIAWQPMKLFMSEKMRKRIHIHNSVTDLLDFFPKSILPKDYGGDLLDEDTTEWLRRMTTPEELGVFDLLSN